MRGIHRWIPRTNGQLRGKCFHLMTSSCSGVMRAIGYIAYAWVKRAARSFASFPPITSIRTHYPIVDPVIRVLGGIIGPIHTGEADNFYYFICEIHHIPLKKMCAIFYRYLKLWHLWFLYDIKWTFFYLLLNRISVSEKSRCVSIFYLWLSSEKTRYICNVLAELVNSYCRQPDPGVSCG